LTADGGPASMPPMSEANGPDKSLLRWQEGGELYEAEERVLKVFREGWKTGEGLVVEDGRMIFAVPPEGSSAPEKPAEEHTADDWQGAILRAEFLRDLFLGNYGKFDPRLIMISFAWIEGRLDLNYCESRLPLAFSRCIFSDGISLRNSIIPELQLPGCEVRESRFIALDAQGAKVSSDVFLDDGFKADGVVSLVGAEVGGQLSCSGGRFEEGLDATNLKTSSAVFMDSRLVEGQVLAFESNGEVILRSAEIGGQLICSGGRFKEGLNAGGLKTSSAVFMDSEIAADGQVLAFESDGEVSLFGAEIGGILICRGGRFGKGLNAEGLKTSSDVLMDSIQGDDGQVLVFESNGGVKLQSAKIDGKLDLGGAKFGRIILNDAEVRRALRLSDLGQWQVDADGFRYRALEIGSIGDSKEGPGPGLKWVAAMSPPSKFSPQHYEHLMSTYRRSGHTNWARKVGFALEERRSKEFKGWRSLAWRAWYGVLKWTIGYGYRPLGFVVWALGLMAAGFLLFSNGHDGVVCGKSGVVPKYASLLEAPLCRANEWIPSDGEALASESWMRNRKPPPDYLPLDPFVYSLEATFPVLSLGQLEKWHPSNGFLLRVRWVWSLVGTLLLAILALFGAGVLGPRWRSGDEGG